MLIAGALPIIANAAGANGIPFAGCGQSRIARRNAAMHQAALPDQSHRVVAAKRNVQA
jgi:hypothetical protein